MPGVCVCVCFVRNDRASLFNSNRSESFLLSRDSQRFHVEPKYGALWLPVGPRRISWSGTVGCRRRFSLNYDFRLETLWLCAA